MGHVTFRFHGRFLHVQHLTDTLQPAKISVVAPRFPANAAGVHQPLMSIRHHSVLFQGGLPKHPLTTFNPSFRALTDSDDRDGQLMVWDLTGLTVRYQTAASQAVGLEAPIPDLAQLEENEGRAAALRVEALDPGQQILSNAVVELLAEGTAPPLSYPQCNFSHEDKARSGAPDVATQKGAGGVKPLTMNPADRVDFAIDVPPVAPGLVLEFFDGAHNSVGRVTVKPGAKVCFSNNCPTIHEITPSDLEFSRYYDLLANHDPEALIPFTATKLTEGIPCYLQGTIQVTAVRTSGGSPLKAIPHPVPKSKPTSRPAARRAAPARRGRARG